MPRDNLSCSIGTANHVSEKGPDEDDELFADVEDEDEETEVDELFD